MPKTHYKREFCNGFTGKTNVYNGILMEYLFGFYCFFFFFSRGIPQISQKLQRYGFLLISPSPMLQQKNLQTSLISPTPNQTNGHTEILFIKIHNNIQGLFLRY